MDNHILTQEQSNELTACIKQLDFCNIPANLIKVNLFTPFQKNFLKLGVQVDLIIELESTKDVHHTGATSGKKSLKVSFAAYEILIMNKVHAFAIDPDNITPDTIVAMAQLEKDMSLREDEIVRMKDADILGFAQGIKTSVFPFLALLLAQGYEVVLADLDLGITMATTFKNTISAASMIEQGSNVAAVDIAKAFLLIEGIQKSLKLNLAHWKVTDTDFVQGFTTAGVVDHLGHSFTILKGVVTGGPLNIPLPDASIINQRTGKAADFNILAQYDMRKMRAHLDNFICACPGYISKIQAIKTESGKAITVNFHLDPIVPAA